MTHDPWTPSPAFLEWLNELPPTPRHAARLAKQAEKAQRIEAAARNEAIMIERKRVRDEKAANRVQQTHANKRGRKMRQLEVHPNSRIHLMEDDDKWRK